MRATFAAICLFLALISHSSHGATIAAPAMSPEAREQRLMTKVGPQTRAWIRTEARRLLAPANAAQLSEAAIARAVRGRGAVPQAEADALSFLVAMEVSRAAQEDLKAVMAQVKAIEDRKRALRDQSAKEALARAQGNARSTINPPNPGYTFNTPGRDYRFVLRDPPADSDPLAQFRLQAAEAKFNEASRLASDAAKKFSDSQESTIRNFN
jgi:hypothetical protein